MCIYRNMYTKNERQHVTTWHSLNSQSELIYVQFNRFSSENQIKTPAVQSVLPSSSVPLFVLTLICRPCPACGLSWGRRWWPERQRWPRWSLSGAPSAPRCAAVGGSGLLRSELHLRGNVFYFLVCEVLLDTCVYSSHVLQGWGPLTDIIFLLKKSKQTLWHHCALPVLLHNEKQDPPPVSKPKMCLSKATGIPWK